jgi:hypothetical protein
MFKQYMYLLPVAPTDFWVLDELISYCSLQQQNACTNANPTKASYRSLSLGTTQLWTASVEVPSFSNKPTHEIRNRMQLIYMIQKILSEQQCVP